MSIASSLRRVTPRPRDGLERRSREGQNSIAPRFASFNRQDGQDCANGRFHVEKRALADLADIAPAWRDLARRALEPNVFYEPEFALATAPVFGPKVEVLLVWSRQEPRRLVGFFPFQISHRRYGLFPSVLVGWTHPYAPLGTALVDGDAPEAVVAALFDYVAASSDLPRLMLFPLAPTQGRWANALAAALVRRGGRVALFDQHRRALLAPPGDRKTYLDRSVSRGKRKELRRQLRRLSERGALVVSQALTPEAIGPALEAFLALEAKGWKGRTGSAAIMQAGVGAFMRQAMHDLSARGGARLVLLSVADRPIAAGIVLRSGERAWFWKIAYDETEARASPGVQLTIELTRSLLADATLEQTDSCATAGHPMIDRLWLERLELADHLLQIGPGGKARFTFACHLETLRRGAVTMAKRLRDRLR
ncbi:MAG: GNAT family N-acetyltransferase [Rhizobiales bacterium]|nr:GNAT family N-acetyltransferase [Hyphomicrobiales bacterium]